MVKNNFYLTVNYKSEVIYHTNTGYFKTCIWRVVTVCLSLTYIYYT